MLYEADIVPGKYALNTEENPKEIIEILSGVTKDQEE